MPDTREQSTTISREMVDATVRDCAAARMPSTIQMTVTHLADELGRLRAALRRHGGHVSGCGWNGGRTCDCGWEEVASDVR
jgi:hypothetical protein